MPQFPEVRNQAVDLFRGQGQTVFPQVPGFHVVVLLNFRVVGECGVVATVEPSQSVNRIEKIIVRCDRSSVIGAVIEERVLGRIRFIEF